MDGTEAQKQRYVAPSVTGEKVGALAITEPDCGSDVAALRTTAVRDDDHYIVNGSKTFITNGADGDFYTLAVRTGEAGVITDEPLNDGSWAMARVIRVRAAAGEARDGRDT